LQGALGTNGLVEVLVVSCKAGSKAGRPLDCGGHTAFSELDWGNSLCCNFCVASSEGPTPERLCKNTEFRKRNFYREKKTENPTIHVRKEVRRKKNP